MLGAHKLIVITDNDLSKVHAGRLPPTLRKLVRLIGLAETLRLTCAFGGARVSLGSVRQPTTKLRRAISEESIQILGMNLDREQIDVPKPDRILSQIRDAYIRDQAQRGATLSELTENSGLTRRRILSIVARK